MAERDGRVDLSFTVTEGPQYVVRGVRVEGSQSTSDSLGDRAVTITSGEAAGQSEAAETERRLYGLGTFRAPKCDSSRIDVGYPVPGSDRASPRWHFSIVQMF